MIRYYICNLENERDFSVDNVTFQSADNYQKRIQILKRDRQDQLTFYATVSDRKLSQPSMLFLGKPATSINDMMILLSLAQSRDIYYPKAEDIGKGETEMWGMPSGNRKAWGYQIIMEHELESFLNTSLCQIRKPNWLNETGFTTAVFWWRESILTNSPLEIRFVSSWIALEILANVHAKSYNLKNSGVRMRIDILANAYNWDFMDSALIKDWTAIRNKYMHIGSIKSLKNIDEDKIVIRYFQLIQSVQVALVDLLGFGNFARKQYVINEIKRQHRDTWKDRGPFPIPPNNKGE